MSPLLANRATIMIAVLAAFILSSFGYAQDASAKADEFQGNFFTDLPYKLPPKDFQFHIWLSPKDKKFKDKVHVFLEQNPDVLFDPTEVDISPSERPLIKAKVMGNDLLVDVVASSQGWEPLNAIVDFGFKAKLKCTLGDKIQNGSAQSFSLKFIDSQGNPISTTAPLTVSVIASNAVLRVDKQGSWNASQDISVRNGGNSTPVIEIMPQGMLAKSGFVNAQVRTDANYVLFDTDDFAFTISPAPLYACLMAILGGLLHSIYESVVQVVKAKGGLAEVFSWGIFGQKAVIGILAGAFAYLLADRNVLGIQSDTTSLGGFFVLGFLFSYLGMDTILRKLKPSASS